MNRVVHLYTQALGKSIVVSRAHCIASGHKQQMKHNCSFVAYVSVAVDIYIYKNECLYVCLSRMRSYTIHPIAMKLR
jgi:hypothetical protein